MSATSPKERLVSLDALRGFDMAFIVGFGGLLHALAVAVGATGLATQFEHVRWDGFRIEDLIFPLFVFIAGASLTFSLPRTVERDGRAAAARRLVKRCAVLFLLGVIYSGGLSKGWDGVRWLGVLQRIALASLGAGLLTLFCGTRGLITAALALLAGYWALLTFVPVPGGTAGDFSEGHNLTNWLDARFLPGRKYDGDHDPEGLLSTLPAIASALLGVLAGRWVQGSASAARKAAGLALAGLVLLALGWAWSVQFPVIKKLWTSSFVLVAGGWSALLFALFFWLVEIRGWRTWTAPWVWIGMNPITIYFVEGLVPVDRIAQRFTGPLAKEWQWMLPLAAFGLVLLFARFLFKRGIFLRV